MTTTITKRADELKPGDVLHAVLYTGTERVAIVEVCSVSLNIDVAGGATAHLRVVTLDGRASILSFTVSTVEVEVPSLTPAQQHAEELLRFVRKIAASDYAQADEEASEVLAKIDPPQPPTLEEALMMVERLYGSDKSEDFKAAWEILDRARRAKIIQ